MSKSILQDEKRCFITGDTEGLHRHHYRKELFMMEYANISIERYTDLILELETLKNELLNMKEFEGKYNALVRNVFDCFTDNERHELYSWNKEKLVNWGITIEEIEGLKKEYENKISGESNSKEDE